MEEHKKGTVKRFNPQRGFGFILTYSNENLFFHIKDVRKSHYPGIMKDDEVSFVIKTDNLSRKYCDSVIVNKRIHDVNFSKIWEDINKRYVGKIKIVEIKDKYGFIICREKELTGDIYFHTDEILNGGKPLKFGDHVTFNILLSCRGIYALNVTAEKPVDSGTEAEQPASPEIEKEKDRILDETLNEEHR